MQLHKNLIIAAQILCEPLPISSSTHVWIVDYLWKKTHFFAQNMVTEQFMDLLFLPTFLVLIAFFRHHTIHLFKTIFKSPSNITASHHYLAWWKIMFTVAGYLIAATVTFAGVYLGLKQVAQALPLTTAYEWIPPVIGLSLTMLFQASLFFAPSTQASETPLNLWKAILIGFMQGFGAIPGVSRLSTTLATARWLNIPPHRAFEFSTLMQIIVFIGNLIKNMVIAGDSGRIFSAQPYAPLVAALSWDSVATICVCTFVSYSGLLLTKDLNTSKSLWKVAPYFAIPITLIAAFH